jgi:hypothetical protein
VLKFLLAVADVAQVQIEKNEDLLVKTERLDGANVGKTQRTGNPVRKKIICRLRHVFELIVPKKKNHLDQCLSKCMQKKLFFGNRQLTDSFR